MVLYRAGDFSSAISYLKRAWVNDPDQSEAALHLMMAYYFVNDQNSYLQTVDRLGSMDQAMMLRFAAQEFFGHGFFKETVKVIEQSMRFFKNDPAMTALADAARGRISGLPK
jgi:thioredoxin-like negative regulator of GroEL